MEINPAIIVQSSLALVVAMTSMKTIEAGLALVENDIPHEILKYRLITLAVVIFLTMLIISCLAVDKKQQNNSGITTSTTNNTTTANSAQVDLPYSSFTPVPAIRRQQY